MKAGRIILTIAIYLLVAALIAGTLATCQAQGKDVADSARGIANGLVGYIIDAFRTDGESKKIKDVTSDMLDIFSGNEPGTGAGLDGFGSGFGGIDIIPDTPSSNDQSVVYVPDSSSGITGSSGIIAGGTNNQQSESSVIIPQQALGATTLDDVSQKTGSIYFVDVGQGDCTIIKSKSHAVMIDTGTMDAADDILKTTRKLGVRSLDYLILTHPHADHMGSAPEVIDELDIKTIIMPQQKGKTGLYEMIDEGISAENCDVITAVVDGKCYQAGDIVFSICAPTPKKQYADVNDTSTVVRLTVGGAKAIIMADAGALSEYDMLMADQPLSADILRVGHHGASDSTSQALLDAVSPQYAVISCGVDNDYGHPHARTLKRLAINAIPTYRTDLQGTITANITDGNIEWVTE